MSTINEIIDLLNSIIQYEEEMFFEVCKLKEEIKALRKKLSCREREEVENGNRQPHPTLEDWEDLEFSDCDWFS